jgi:hypothetical protein
MLLALAPGWPDTPACSAPAARCGAVYAPQAAGQLPGDGPQRTRRGADAMLLTHWWFATKIGPSAVASTAF